MKHLDVYQENETVMIKAKIAKVIFEKDKVSYELKDFNTEQRYLSKYSDKDILPYNALEALEEES